MQVQCHRPVWALYCLQAVCRADNVGLPADIAVCWRDLHEHVKPGSEQSTSHMMNLHYELLASSWPTQMDA